MLKISPPHVRGNLVGYIALFVALGGTAMASVIVTSNSQVAQNTISGHISKKNGKTSLFAGLALWHVIIVAFADVAILAASRDQAGKLLSQLTGYIKRSPELRGQLRITQRVVTATAPMARSRSWPLTPTPWTDGEAPWRWSTSSGATSRRRTLAC
jgi:hypothetical protein